MSRKRHPPTAQPSAISSRVPVIIYSIAAALALAGLADAVYLTVMDLTGQSAVCGGSAGCSQVLASKYSHIGRVPVAALGVLGYFAVFSCATFAAFGWMRARWYLTLAVGLMFLGTLWLLVVQAFFLHQFCRFCLASAAVTFLLAGIVVATAPSRSSR